MPDTALCTNYNIISKQIPGCCHMLRPTLNGLLARHAIPAFPKEPFPRAGTGLAGTAQGDWQPTLWHANKNGCFQVSCQRSRCSSYQAINRKIKTQQGSPWSRKRFRSFGNYYPVPQSKNPLCMLKTNQVKTVYDTRHSHPPRAACCMWHATKLPNSDVVLDNLHKSPLNLLHLATICGPAGRYSCQLPADIVPSPSLSHACQLKLWRSVGEAADSRQQAKESTTEQ